MADQFVCVLGELPITVIASQWPQAAESLILRARPTGLTAYDAAYLSLALHHQCKIATQDQKLRQAAADLGIALMP
jgi:predicted nucleic acid-binding protein